jgi:colanic acid/amylovoran biosynthesis protein
MKVLITNSVVLNGGEAATVMAVVEVIRRAFGAQTECVIYEQNPEAAARYYPELSFRKLLYYSVAHAPRIRIIGSLIGRLNRSRFLLAARAWSKGWRRLARLMITPQERSDLEHYDSADVVISTGGTYLVDNYNLDPRLFDYQVTLALKKPLVFFTQSIGPIEKPGNRRRLRPVLERARLILLRDQPSLKHVRNMDVTNPHVHLSADAVFALGSTNGKAQLNGHARTSSSSERPKAAISVRHWLHFKSADTETGMNRYRRAIVTATDHLIRTRHFNVTFVSSCQGVREYWADDSAEAERIVQMLAPDVRKHVTVDRGFRTPNEMVGALHGFDLVIATRFHMAIFAMLAGTPAVAIAYEFKTQELYRTMGAPDWVLDIETVEGNALCAAVDRCIENEPAVAARISAAVARERELAWSAGELIKRAMARPMLQAGAET